MSTRPLGGGKSTAGRKSKGDRYSLTVRLPQAQADWVLAQATARGMTYGDFVVSCVARSQSDDGFLADLDEGRLFAVPPP